MIREVSEFRFDLYVSGEPDYMDNMLGKLREMHRVAEDLTQLGLDVRMDLTAEDGRQGRLRLIGTPKSA